MFVVEDDDLTWITFTKENNTWYAYFRRPVQTKAGDRGWQHEDFYFTRFIFTASGNKISLQHHTKQMHEHRVALHKMRNTIGDVLTSPYRQGKTLGELLKDNSTCPIEFLQVLANGPRSDQITVKFPDGGMDVCGTVGFGN